MRFAHFRSSFRWFIESFEAGPSAQRPQVEPLESRQLLSVAASPVAPHPPAIARSALHGRLVVATGSVSGSIVDSSGKGIAGAEVVLSLVPSMTGTSATGKRLARLTPATRILVVFTDKQGNFTRGNLPVGTYTATAFKPGYQKAVAAPFTVSKGQNTPVPAITLAALPAPAFGSVTGTITDASGKPLAGAVVEIVPTSPAGKRALAAASHRRLALLPQPVRVAITDQDGHYTFNIVRTGTYVVTASDKGYQSATSAPFTVVKGSNTAPTLALATAVAPVLGTVNGSATDSSGKPIAGAQVELLPPFPIPLGGTSTGAVGGTVIKWPLPSVRVASTDQNGHYSFDNVPAGTYTVSASAQGYETATSPSFAVAKGDNTAPTLALTPIPPPVFGSVSGAVTDSNGKPLAGALVELSPPGKPVPLGPTSGQPIIFPPPWPVLVTKTDANGHYNFDKVSTGTYVVSASADGYQSATSAPFTVSEGSNTAPTLALMVLPAPVLGTVNGSVTDSSGKPIAGAVVDLSPSVPWLGTGGTSATPVIGPPFPVRVATTDQSGHYTFDSVPAGQYVVSAAAEGYQRATSDPFTVAKGDNTAPALALTPVPTPIFGSVSGIVTDSSGKALAGAVVQIFPPKSPIPLGPTPGLPIIFPPPGSVRVTTTDSTGHYSFDKVPTGTYVVSASASGYQSATSAPFTVSQGSNTAPTLALTALPPPVIGAVSGLVTDSSSKPIAGASVELFSVFPNDNNPTGPGTGIPIIPPPVVVLVATTDDKGQYTFAKVPTGTYLVAASAAGYQKAISAPFAVSEGSNTAPTLALNLGDPLATPIPPPL